MFTKYTHKGGEILEKTVLITGGNKGIGLETTEIFLERDYKVIALGRDFKDFPFDEGENLRKINFNLRDVDDIPNLINSLGEIDILINNAGIMNSVSYNNYPKDDIEKILKVNLEAPIKLITEVSKSMIKNKFGRIVNVASVAGEIGHIDVWYGITKAGLINSTKSFAKILGDKGIIINAIAPGPVETEMLKIIPESRKNSLIASTYTKRFAKPLEIAKVILWLSTEVPEYINGTCIDINNGAFPR